MSQDLAISLRETEIKALKSIHNKLILLSIFNSDKHVKTLLFLNVLQQVLDYHH